MPPAGGGSARQRVATPALEEVQYDLGAPAAEPAAAARPAEEEPPSTPSASNDVAGSVTPGSGCSSGSGRSARPPSRRWVRRPASQQEAPEQQQQPQDSTDAAGRPAVPAPASSPGPLARGFSTDLPRHISSKASASLDDQGGRRYGVADGAVPDGAATGEAIGGAGGFRAEAGATPPPLAAGMRRLTSLRQPNPREDLSSASCASIAALSTASSNAQDEASEGGGPEGSGSAIGGGDSGGGRDDDAAETPSTTAATDWNPMQQPTPALSSVARSATNAAPSSRLGIGSGLAGAAAGGGAAVGDADAAVPAAGGAHPASPVNVPRPAAPPAPLSQQSVRSEDGGGGALRKRLPRQVHQDAGASATPPASSAHPDAEVRAADRLFYSPVSFMVRPFCWSISSLVHLQSATSSSLKLCQLKYSAEFTLILTQFALQNLTPGTVGERVRQLSAASGAAADATTTLSPPAATFASPPMAAQRPVNLAPNLPLPPSVSHRRSVSKTCVLMVSTAIACIMHKPAQSCVTLQPHCFPPSAHFEARRFGPIAQARRPLCRHSAGQPGAGAGNSRPQERCCGVGPL